MAGAISLLDTSLRSLHFILKEFWKCLEVEGLGEMMSRLNLCSKRSIWYQCQEYRVGGKVKKKKRR